MEVAAVLHELGLSEKEATVYLRLLAVGEATLQEIASGVELPRTTTYNTLHYLKARGLAGAVLADGVTSWRPSPPEALAEALEQKRALLDSVMPHLQALDAQDHEKTRVQAYLGVRGLSTILSEIFLADTEALYFGSYQKSLERLRHLPSHFRNLRLERGVHARIIIERAEEEIFTTKEYRRLTRMRHLDWLAEFPCMVFIVGDRVAAYTVDGELVGFVVDNAQFATAMHMLFEMLWKQADSPK